MTVAGYKNAVTGVQVEVADEKVLSADWEPIEKPKSTKKPAEKSAD